MTLSVQEALQLPIMKNTKLVAGFNGITNVIKWVTVVEVIDDIERLQEGEFLITTGFGLSDNSQKKGIFNSLLSTNKLSGVAIYTGFYLNEIPDCFIETANRNNLPILEIPTDINFSMITKALLEQIVNRQIQLLEYSLHVHNELTNLVLTNEGISPITRTLSGLFNGSIIVFDEIANVTDKRIEEQEIHLEEDKINTKATTNTTIIENFNKYLKLNKPIYFEKNFYRVMVCPIIANHVNYGFIVALKKRDQWKELDNIAVEHSASVYAIEFLKEKAVEETQIRLQGEFLEEIINKNFKSPTIALERGKRLGYDLTLRQSVFYFKVKNINSNDFSLKELLDYLYQMIQNILNKKNKQHILRNKFDALILLTEVEGESIKDYKDYCFQIAHEINDTWENYYPFAKLTIGIGKTYKEISQLGQSAREAEYACNFSNLLLKPKSIIHYDDLGLYHLLIHMKESNIDLEQFYYDILGPLIRSSSADLLHTLETYLTNNQSIQTTSQELFIHRHTLKYRLKQIEKKTGLDIKSADERIKLQLAIMAYRLLHYEY